MNCMKCVNGLDSTQRLPRTMRAWAGMHNLKKYVGLRVKIYDCTCLKINLLTDCTGAANYITIYNFIIIVFASLVHKCWIN